VSAALVIPVEGDTVKVDFPEENPGAWAGLIGAVSGCDFITLRDQRLQVIVDDRSMLDGRPVNTRMTWFLKGTGRWMSEVHGTVLLVGMDDGGESVDLHEVLLTALLGGGGS